VNGISAWDVCIALKNNGLLAKPTHEHIIRFTPPLIINAEQLLMALEIIKKTFVGLGA
jgi:ornithine--oxo-acid transaminase